jgi:hypothetical protein
MADCKKLRDPRINVSASPADGELARALEIVGNEEPVEGLDGLRRVLDELGCCRGRRTSSGRTLDLIAHSDPARLLRLGQSVIDPDDEGVRTFFERMAADQVLDRLYISELRLLGCETAMSSEGQAAIRTLTDILGIRVVGTTKLVYAAYFGEKGLKERYEPMLCDASMLPDLDEERARWPVDPPPERAPPFQPDSLETTPADELPAVSWPRVGEDADARPRSERDADVRPLVDLIEGGDGRVMPRMLVQPRCEVLLGSGDEQVRRVEILFDHELVRVRPAGTDVGAVYRVRNPAELAAWVASVDTPRASRRATAARKPPRRKRSAGRRAS